MKARGYNSVHSWCIAAGCGFINLMTQVPIRLAGLLFVAMLDRYDTDRALASWPFTICVIMRCAPGPLIAYLGEYMGLRYLTLLGTLLAAFGVGFCYFAESMAAVIIFFGVTYGIGMSFANVMMPQVLKQHFDRNIAHANGFTLAASCLGAFVFSPVLKLLLNKYGLSGSFLIIFAIMLNGIPIAFLLRNPRYKKALISVVANNGNNKKLYRAVPVIDPESGEELEHQTNKKKIIEEGADTETKKENAGTNSAETDSNRTEIVKPNIDRTDEIENDIQLTKPIRTESDREVPLKTESDRTEVNETYICFQTEDKLITEGNNEKQKLEESLKQINFVNNSDKSETNDMTQVYVATTEAVNSESKLKAALETLTLFKDPVFLVILITHGALAFAANCIYTILVDTARDKGISEDLAIYFVMALPAAELTGYLGLGWITDMGFLSNANYIALCLFLFTVGCGDLVWSTSFFAMLIGVLLIGICAAGIGTAFPGLIYEFIEEDKQAMAISSRLMLFTPLSFTMAPMIGYFRDTLGSYAGLLYLQGSINLACCVAVLFIPCLKRRRNAKERQWTFR